MIAQQLTTELTQPNVLVEIDPGPPMGLHEEAQRHAPGKLQAQMTDPGSIISMSRFRPADPQPIEAADADGCLAPRFACGGASASIGVEANGTQVQVREGDSGQSLELVNASCRPSWAHGSTPESTVQDTAQAETAFVGMDHLKLKSDKQDDAGQHATGITPSPSSGWNPPTRIHPRAASSDDYHPALAVLPARAASGSSPVSSMTTLDDGPFKITCIQAQASPALLSPLRSREVLLNESFNGHGNAHNRVFVNEKRVAEDQLASVFGGTPKNTSHCDLPIGRKFRTGRLKETQSTGRGDTNDVESPLPMSWAAGSKTNFSVDTKEVAREVFMWMNQYEMMTSQCEQQSPVRWFEIGTELLLNFVSATISCLHALQRRKIRIARVKQCTEEVHCLLDDPGARLNPTYFHNHQAQEGADRMETYANFASYDMTLDDIDPSEIQQMLQQIQWEQSINEQIFAGPEYDTTNFDPSLTPLSGYASPSSMTTASTNQSPVVPQLDYDMSFSGASSMDDPESLFSELMGHSIIMQPDWMGAMPEGYSGPFSNSHNAQPKVPSMYPIDSQLYPTTTPETTLYSSNPTFEPYPTTQAPPATAQTSQPTPPPSSSQTTTTTDLLCSHCGATFIDKTKLKVHTNKHTKPFRCTAAGCDYATAEKKSLQRHLLAKSKWDEEHRAAAQSEGVRQVKHRCPREGCTYSTIREDNLKRHVNTCAQ